MRVQGDCAPLWIFIQGRARSDLLFTMSDNTHPVGRTRPGAKSLLLDEPRVARGNPHETEENSRARSRKDRSQKDCSDPASKRDRRSGGARRDRTDDLLLAKQALSQLSYGPSGAQTTDGGRQTISVVRRLHSVVRILSSGNWWAWEDLNFRPHAYQARALTS